MRGGAPGEGGQRAVCEEAGTWARRGRELGRRREETAHRLHMEPGDCCSGDSRLSRRELPPARAAGWLAGSRPQ